MKRILRKALIVMFGVLSIVCCIAISGCSKGGGKKFVDYRLNSFVCSITGQEDIYIDVNKMSAEDRAAYEAVILMYGKQVKISSDKIQFVDGTAFAALGEVKYSLNGDNVIFSEPALSSSFNYTKLSNGVFSIGIQQSMPGSTVSYSFDYYAEGASVPSFNIAFDTNGGSSVATQTVNKGGTPQKPQPPTKEGCEFDGWYADSGYKYPYDFSNKIFKNTTVYAKWKNAAYTVKFYTNGGTSVKSQKVENGKKATKPAAPTKTGYVFLNWYKDKDYKELYKFNEPVTGDITIYAKFSPKSYKLNFNAFGGTCDTETKSVTYNVAVGKLPTPEKENFTFDGWYDSAEGGKRYTNNTVYKVAEDTQLYARWTTEITLDTDGIGSVTKNKVKAIYGSKQSGVASLPTPSNGNGAIFKGWFTERGAKGEEYTNDAAFEFDGPVTLYAAWELSVTYHSEGGTALSGSTVIKGSTFTPKTPTRTGYTFLGWNTLPDNSGDMIDETTVITQNAPFDLYAIWKLNEVTFHFDTQGGSELGDEVFTYNSTLGELPVPQKDGNEFGGWYTEIGGEGTEYTATTVCKVPTLEFTLYAKWTANIIYDYCGATSENSVAKDTFVYNKKIYSYPYLSLPQPLKTGWSFEGWFTEENGKGRMLTNNKISAPDSTVWDLDGDTTVYAYWVKGTDKRYLQYSEQSDGSVAVHGLKDSTITELEIPAVINLKNVTAIFSSAFYDENLVSVTIPDSVQSIGKGAFKGCPLTEITLPFIGESRTATSYNSVFGFIFGYQYETSSYDVVNNAIYQCKISGGVYDYYYWYFIPKTLERVTVTDIQTVPACAFNNCNMLKEVTLGGTEQTIGASAFSSCSNLTTINGIENLVNISNYAFNDCKLLTTFPEKPLEKVGAYSFFNCSNLSEIQFSEKLETIGEKAFENVKLTSVTVPDSVQSIGNGAFKGCPLTEITLPFIGESRTATSYNSVFGFIFGYQYETFSSHVVSNAIYQCKISSGASYYYYWYFIPKTLERVTVTDIQTVPTCAFNNCTMLKEVTLSGTEQTVGASAFSSCSNLTTINGIENLVNISNYAFNDCKLLTTFPEKPLEKVGAYSFFNCSNLLQIRFSENLTSIGEKAFSGCNRMTQIDFNNKLQSIGEYAFENVKLTSVTVPDSVQSIGNGAFKGCPLTEITLPFIGESRTATSYNSVFGFIFGYQYETFSSHVVSNAIYQCKISSGASYYYYWYFIPKTLERVTVTDTQTINACAFNNCTMLKEINLLCNITAINKDALSCANLEILKFSGAAPETVSTSAALSKNVTIIAPAEYLDDYQAKFAGYNVISDESSV